MSKTFQSPLVGGAFGVSSLHHWSAVLSAGGSVVSTKAYLLAYSPTSMSETWSDEPAGLLIVTVISVVVRD